MRTAKKFTLASLCIASLALLACATTLKAQTVDTGIVKLADSNIEYFSRGKGETIVLLPGGTLTVGYFDGLANALAKADYRVVGINFRRISPFSFKPSFRGEARGLRPSKYAPD